MDITGPDAVEICNATAGSGSPANALHWDGTVDWPLMLCSTKTLSNFLKLPGRPESTVLLIVPAGRFPKGVSSLPADAKPTDIPQTLFEEEEVCLVLLRNTRLAPVPGEGALAELSAIMSRFILFGAWGLSLHWGNERFSLDNKYSDEGADLLAETGLLQSASDKPHRTWHHSHTWLGILPAKFDGRVGKALMLLSPTARQKAKDTIALTILAGQHKSWLATESMITRYLKRQKVIQKATNLQRPAPIFRRLYPSLGPSRAIFPPSTRIAEKAAEYLRTGGPMDRAGFLLCAAKLGLGSRELPSVWLAVHILGVNSTVDELAAARGPDPVPAPDYGIGVPHNGSSFLTPGNHERLLQAEARTRTALNNSTTETKVSGFERCKAIMIRRLRMGNTPQEQREEQHQSNVESIPPNERDKVALSSGPEAPAPHAALPDTSLSTKRAEGLPIRTEATLTGSLNHLASGGARIYTTPDLPVDLTEEEEPMAVADIPDEILAGIISGLPGPPGHLLRPISISERQLAQLIWSSPGVHGQERAMEHISNTHWYSGTTMDTLATKLSQWVLSITGSTRWLFLGPDIPNGLSDGRTYAWSRQKLRRLLTDDTEFVCWICNSGTHWFLAVADIPSSTLHIYNSSGSMGNEVATKLIHPLLQYNGSFEGSNFGPTWEIVLQHSPQQRNGYDCGPFTIANCLRVVYAWDRFLQVTPPPMPDFRLRVCLLVLTSPSGPVWCGTC